LLLSVSMFPLGASNGLTCLHCDAVEQPKYCARVERCQPGQVNIYSFSSIFSSSINDGSYIGNIHSGRWSADGVHSDVRSLALSSCCPFSGIISGPSSIDDGYSIIHTSHPWLLMFTEKGPIWSVLFHLRILWQLGTTFQIHNVYRGG